MLKYAKIVDEKTKQCVIGVGTNVELYKSLGFTEMEVEQAYNSQWYLKGYAPEKPEPTLEEQLVQLEAEYEMNRWQREAILAENSPYSEFAKRRARELEIIAEQIRKKNL